MSKEERKVEWSLDLENMKVRAGQFVSETMGEPAETKRETLRDRKDGAASARIAIEFSLGRATISALDVGSPLLFKAELEYVGELAYEVSGGAERVISLRQKASAPQAMAAFLKDEEELHWDIALAPNIPLTLALKGGLGASDLDLSGLNVERATIETGVGQAQLTTPLWQKDFAAQVKGGVGKAAITIPAGSQAQLELIGGVGAFSVAVAPGAAIRMKAKTGLGRFNLPEGMKRVDSASKGMNGTWETSDFADADQPVLIDFQGGIGSFSLEYFKAL
ncbi:MAG: hypothetical protein OXI30_07445 [Chloroflexota bacterium]|nr:hypothetical protein [Chloroflexota bacterium]